MGSLRDVHGIFVGSASVIVQLLCRARAKSQPSAYNGMPFGNQNCFGPSSPDPTPLLLSGAHAFPAPAMCLPCTLEAPSTHLPHTIHPLYAPSRTPRPPLSPLTPCIPRPALTPRHGQPTSRLGIWGTCLRLPAVAGLTPAPTRCQWVPCGWAVGTNAQSSSKREPLPPPHQRAMSTTSQ